MIGQHRFREPFACSLADGDRGELAVRQAASDRLPETMLPDQFVLVADLPLTSSSKVDERRLLKEAGLSPPNVWSPHDARW